MDKDGQKLSEWGLIVSSRHYSQVYSVFYPQHSHIPNEQQPNAHATTQPQPQPRLVSHFLKKLSHFTASFLIWFVEQYSTYIHQLLSDALVLNER